MASLSQSHREVVIDSLFYIYFMHIDSLFYIYFSLGNDIYKRQADCDRLKPSVHCLQGHEVMLSKLLKARLESCKKFK
jgi:hypothetical protein